MLYLFKVFHHSSFFLKKKNNKELKIIEFSPLIIMQKEKKRKYIYIKYTIFLNFYNLVN